MMYDQEVWHVGSSWLIKFDKIIRGRYEKNSHEKNIFGYACMLREMDT